MHTKDMFENLRYLALSESSTPKLNKLSEMELLKLINNQTDCLAGNTLIGELIQVFNSNQLSKQLLTTITRYGGTAVLGGLAYRAVVNWKQSYSFRRHLTDSTIYNKGLMYDNFKSHAIPAVKFQLILIKALLITVKVSIGDNEQELTNLREHWQSLDLSVETKTLCEDLAGQDINLDSVAHEVRHILQKSELYLVSYLSINPNKTSNKFYLELLAEELGLPEELVQEIQWQIHLSINEAA